MAETLSGIIERVTSHDAESGFAVLRVQPNGRRGLVTVVGHLPNATAGEYVEATGSWVQHREYGTQFKADTLRTMPPHTRDGIVKYLGSGLVKGIGPHFARKIVDVFGERTLEVIDESPTYLKEVKGIGLRRIQRIRESWQQQKAVRGIMVFLQSHGVGTARAVRIYKTYGERALELVRANPYRLAADVWGFGFQTADELAQRLGIDRASPLRARAALRYVLQQLSIEGHVGYPEDSVIDRTAELTGIDRAVVAAAVEDGKREDELVREPWGFPHPSTPSPTRGEGENFLPSPLVGDRDRWEVPEDLRRQMVEVARQFRKEPTRGEALLWEALRGKKVDGVKFRRQQPIGPFVVDFFASSQRLIVEVDGPIHDEQQEADQRRQALLESLGLRFLRIRTELVESNPAQSLKAIRAALVPPPTPDPSATVPPLPHKGGGETTAPPSPLVGEGGRGGEGAPWLYLKPLFLAELGVARSLHALTVGSHPLAGIDAEAVLSWVEKRIGLELAPSQRDAIRQSASQKVLVITGGPGTGKTTLVRGILEVFAGRGNRCALCAPTGRAAKRLTETTGREAKTIHRLLEFDPALGGFKHDRGRPLDLDLLVVDEASMVDVALMNKLAQAVPPHACLVLVGDVDQLPSVGPGTVLADAIGSGVVPVVRLTEIFRQAGASWIVRAAHAVNSGEMPESAPPGQGDFYFVEADDPETIVDRIVTMVRERIPARFGLDPFRDVQVLTPMNRSELGTANLNARLQAVLNPPRGGVEVERFGWRFRAGDKVIQTQNDYDKDVFNGDIGRVSEINTHEQELTVEFDGRPVTYDFGELDELALAYACTVHKSQGSEYPAVVIPLHGQHFMMLQRNLLYTGVTRGKRLVVVVGSRKALSAAVQRRDSALRYSALGRRLREMNDG